MIVFHCSNCRASFPAKLRIRGFSYKYEGKDRTEELEHLIERDDDICHLCLAEAEKGKQEALNKRKKND